MTVCLWKRFSLLLLLALTLMSVGCSKKVAPAPPPPPPPPPAAPPTPAPTITLSVDRPSITAGQSAMLSYTATNATAVTINPGIGAVQPATGGTRQINPAQTTSFTARATGPGGTADSAAVNVVVTAAAPPPPPPPPPPVKNDTRPPTKTLDQLFTETMVPILFDYDKATIGPIEESKLLNNAAWLKQNPTVKFQIEGHADERGSQEYNIALGDERAAAVKKFLAGQGIADARMSTISYGEERPACREQSEACWQKNRRAAFVRMP
jgi:peptidoglycan-associated lipoprotein